MVSIIIPLYNTEKYIEQCIRSILEQTYKKFEIIIVNDGSTDNSYEIVRKISDCNQNIILINQKNKGVSIARKNGLGAAKGDFILFVDSDDYLEKNCLEEMVKKTQMTNSDIVICGYRSFDDNSKNFQYHKYDIEDRVYTNNEVVNMIFDFSVKGFLCDKLFRKENLIKHNFDFEPKKYVEDWYPVLKEIYKSDRICFVNEALYNYRQRQNSAAHQKNIEVVNCYFDTIKKIKKYIVDNEISIEVDNMNTFNINTFYTLARNYYLSYQKEPKSKVYREFKKNYDNKSMKLMELLKPNNSSKETLLKVLLWKLKIFHLIYPK